MDAGVQAFLVEEAPGGLGALTGQGVGWIKLQVREVDVDRAMAALGDPPGDDEIPWDEATAADASDEGEKAELERAIAEQKAGGPPSGG